MIEAISHRLAVKLKEVNPEETVSIDVMKFALIGIIHNILTLSTAFFIGLILGQFYETLVAAVSFMGLRFVSGGFHFKSPWSCLIFSSFIFISIPFCSNLLLESELIVVNTISLLLCLLFAPSNIKNHIRVSEKYFPLFKLISLVVIITNYIFITPIITVAFFVQSVTLITFKRR